MKLASILASICLIAPVCTAQAINIDLGQSVAPGSIPPATYGAAAGQAGVWNQISPGLPAVIPLLDVAGLATSASFHRPASWAHSSMLPGAPLGDQALLGDSVEIDYATFLISGLSPGNYLVYTYAPLAPDLGMSVGVFGSTDRTQNLGGEWPGAMVHGVSHAIHHVRSEGTIEVVVFLCGFCPSVCCGIQIVPEVPGPGFDLCLPGTAGTIPCPCANPPASATGGCENSSGTGGASLIASGTASLSSDTLLLSTVGEPPSATSVVSQGDLVIASVAFGQGVRCVGGSLKRLYTKSAAGGHISAPSIGELSISARSALLGDVLAAGMQRHYYVYYRDPFVLGPCPSAATFNVTQAGSSTWSP